MTEITTERMSYLREYLRDKLQANADDGDIFLDNGEDRIVWVSRSDEIGVVVITLAPAKIEVNT